MAQHSDALRDRFANIMTFDVTESAAGSITFATIETNVGIDSSRRTGVAILVDEIDYYLHQGDINLILDAADSIAMGLTISSGVADLNDVTDRRILHSHNLLPFVMGVAASGSLFQSPMRFQFFPPLIMAERQIHLGVIGTSLASAVRLRARVYYRTIHITSDEFVEIAEVFRLVS